MAVTNLTHQVQHPGGSLLSMDRSEEHSSARECESNGQIDSLRVLKRMGWIEFPKFIGEDFDEWMYKVDQFFEFENIPDEMKIKVASVLLDEEALYWHRSYMKGR